ncbi:hypothetical protein O181_017745 [Austropuccinia psidii MF-1]|uniref:Uncharacterized protein n=1 Tax=Austropuccinia psidii MF-1 TaxID=1389203 RepID=A0A9Q3GTB9_9BASI|nr:hypothetical protein [Austropuccinia psidii MF-1]
MGRADARAHKTSNPAGIEPTISRCCHAATYIEGERLTTGPQRRPVRICNVGVALTPKRQPFVPCGIGAVPVKNTDSQIDSLSAVLRRKTLKEQHTNARTGCIKKRFLTGFPLPGLLA